MIAWLTGAQTSCSDRSLAISAWTLAVERELHAELHLASDKRLAFEFLDLATAVIPSEFEARLMGDGGDAEAFADILLECVFNFIGALKLPRAAERFVFVATGAVTRPFLVRRTAQTLEVTMLALYARHDQLRGAQLRSHQLCATIRRSDTSVLEQIRNSCYDLRLPSAAQCTVMLLANHFAAPLGDTGHLSIPANLQSVDLLVDRIQQHVHSIGTGAALTGLFYLYLCDAGNIGVCNDLLEEAVSFADRLTATNCGEELARLAVRVGKYIARLRRCVVSSSDLVVIVRDIARALFGASTSSANSA
jgi:hypothetical protein